MFEVDHKGKPARFNTTDIIKIIYKKMLGEKMLQRNDFFFFTFCLSLSLHKIKY